MNSDKPIPTRNLLLSLGFKPDPDVLYTDSPGLSFDFGDFKVEAKWQLNRRFANIVLISGIFSDERILAMIEGELPLHVESIEQGKAFVTWSLDNAIGSHFENRTVPEWLVEGRAHFHLLPWEREAASYAARPQCLIRREWARVGLKELSQHLATVEGTKGVYFSFDGEVLRIRCGESLIAMAARGEKWTSTYSIEARELRSLPRRLMRPFVEVSIWKSGITIGGFRYTPVIIDSLEGSNQ
jgi:hypothetical protein